MKLCVFQGTFNPIHKAHLRVAGYAMDKYKFDKMLFIPAFNPPHKTVNPDLSIHRLNMVKLAIKNLGEKFELSDIEYKLKGKSYTIRTIEELYKIYDIDGKINFIIGTDAFKLIGNWYDTQNLKNKVKFLVFLRQDNFDISEYDNLYKAGYDFEFQTLEFENISSTQLRKSIQTNSDLSHYVTREVEEYIYKNELYKD